MIIKSASEFSLGVVGNERWESGELNRDSREMKSSPSVEQMNICSINFYVAPRESQGRILLELVWSLHI
jgi:hypothetical protein